MEEVVGQGPVRELPVGSIEGCCRGLETVGFFAAISDEQSREIRTLPCRRCDRHTGTIGNLACLAGEPKA
jgi:hypothetical protein